MRYTLQENALTEMHNIFLGVNNLTQATNEDTHLEQGHAVSSNRETVATQSQNVGVNEVCVLISLQRKDAQSTMWEIKTK